MSEFIFVATLFVLAVMFGSAIALMFKAVNSSSLSNPNWLSTIIDENMGRISTKEREKRFEKWFNSKPQIIIAKEFSISESSTSESTFIPDYSSNNSTNNYDGGTSSDYGSSGDSTNNYDGGTISDYGSGGDFGTFG